MWRRSQPKAANVTAESMAIMAANGASMASQLAGRIIAISAVRRGEG